MAKAAADVTQQAEHAIETATGRAQAMRSAVGSIGQGVTSVAGSARRSVLVAVGVGFCLSRTIRV